MKNVEIISMQNVDNYGSVLQAYALKKIIGELGCKVSFNDIEKGRNRVLNQQCAQGDIARNSPRKIEGFWPKRQLLRVMGKIYYMRMAKIFKKFREEYGLNSVGASETFDVCVIGSDEVFNCMQNSSWGFSTQLFGDVKNANKVITYAACCGFTKSDMLSEELKVEIQSAMNHLSAISVRDTNTARFVNTLSGKSYHFNLDPVAVGDFTRELQDIDISFKLSGKYCIVYSYNRRIDRPDEIQAITQYCKKHNLKIIAPYGRQDWIKESALLTPFELLKAFQNAECIITDTFHGTLFGAKFGKHMAILVRDSNRNKLTDLVKRLHLEKHLVENVNQLDDILSMDLDEANIQKVFKDERIKSIEYLKKNLQ